MHAKAGASMLKKAHGACAFLSSLTWGGFRFAEAFFGTVAPGAWQNAAGEDAFFMDAHALGVADGVGCMARDAQSVSLTDQQNRTTANWDS